ncbi:MAG: 50S ribosomal protein L29 [Anaerolineales bacterium]|nr:50S ribosomal protein L29 [Anaerolineales bacterium]
MHAKEVRGLQSEELKSKLDDLRQELFNLRFKLYSGQQKDSSRLKATRREIARVATILREREIAAALAAKKEN